MKSAVDLVVRAREIAKKAHAGQKRYGGEPYFIHPKAVAQAVKKPFEKMVAFLHDVLEDCPDWTVNDLRREGFPDEVLEAVEAITQPEDEDYLEYILRVKANPLATIVKIEDIKHNKSCLDPKKNRNKVSKYELALHILTNGRYAIEKKKEKNG